MKIGDRVTVKLRDPDRFASGAATALEGATGVVTSFAPNSYNGDGPGPGPAWLVEFDSPRPTWWTHQIPVTAFWFPAGDLKISGPVSDDTK